MIMLDPYSYVVSKRLKIIRDKIKISLSIHLYDIKFENKMYLCRPADPWV